MKLCTIYREHNILLQNRLRDFGCDTKDIRLCLSNFSKLKGAT